MEEARIITWQKLEETRMNKLGIDNKYSRHFNVLRKSQGTPGEGLSREAARLNQTAPEAERPTFIPKAETYSHRTYGVTRARMMKINGKNIIVNSLAPFYSLGKPTCGYFFSRETEHRKLNFGIPASDLVKWRNLTTPVSPR